MDTESQQDMETYDWLDDDEHYPLDSVHALMWRMVDGQLFATCEEHDVQVHHKGIDPDTAAEDRAEWISERRSELERTCTNKQRTMRPLGQRIGQRVTWGQPVTSGPSVAWAARVAAEQRLGETTMEAERRMMAAGQRP